MYKYILLDLDDTLIDYHYSTEIAFNKLLKKYNLYKDNLYEYFKIFELEYWKQTESHLINLEAVNATEKIEYLRSEMIRTFFNVDFQLGYNMYLYYESMLAFKVKKTEEYKEELTIISNNSQIIISTNGNRKQALEKIKKINLTNLVTDLISSEDCGYSKASVNYYEYLLNKLNIKNKKDILIVGDSLESDINGGNLNDIDTCWYNKFKAQNNTLYTPTMEVESFKQLVKKIY